MSARAMLSEIDTNGEPVTLSASESHILEVADGGKTPFSAVAQTVGFDLGKSKMLYLPIGID
jgi:hypothetical protein